MQRCSVDQLTRRDAIRAFGLALGAAGLGACSGKTESPALGGIGDPIPGIDNAPKAGEHADATDTSARDALSDWHNRSRVGSGGPVSAELPRGVIARTDWAGGGPITSLSDPMRRVTRITIHHEGSTPFYSTRAGDVRQRLDLIRRAHLSRGWADIGYHYVIDPAGRVFQGRPTYLQGAHVKYNNEQNLGIMVLGNFEEQTPTPQAVASLERFVATQMARYRVPLRAVHTHQELRATLCPGRNLQGRLIAMRRTTGALARV